MTVEQRLDQLEKRKEYLTGAHLSGADLRNADLYGAKLYGAKLEDARNLPELSAKREEDARRSDCG
jgi:uncharacterized protein YjbI with pentapeptide repeats